MPDKTKLAQLSKLNYKIAKSCSLCVFGDFKGTTLWGSCNRATYQHQKHTHKKLLSIHRAGVCDAFEFDAEKLTDLQNSGFDQFLISGPVKSGWMCPSCKAIISPTPKIKCPACSTFI